MYNQSIAGIRSNLEAFSQAAAKIAQPQTTEVLAGKPPEKTSTTQTPTRAQDANAPKETTNDPSTRSQALTDIDWSRETIHMMIAQKGVEANLGVLKAALSLSGQTVDILA
jgi:flagellar basal body rod protein FlgC